MRKTLLNTRKYSNTGFIGSGFGFGMPTILMQQEGNADGTAGGDTGGNAPTPTTEQKVEKPFKTFKTESEFNNYFTAKTQEATTIAQKEAAAKVTGSIAQSIENDVFEVSGIEKKEGEKYHEYLKRAFNETKSLTAKDSDAKILESLNKQKSKFEETKQTYESRIAELEAQNSRMSKEKQISKHLPSNLKTDEVSKVYIESTVNQATEFDFVEGQDGTTLIKKGDNFVSDENGNPYTLDNWFASKLKVVTAEAETQKGGGAAGTNGKTSYKPNSLGITIGEVKTTSELSQKMREEAAKKGIDTNSVEFREAVYEEGKARGFVK